MKFIDFVIKWNKLQKYKTPKHHKKIAEWLESLYYKKTNRKGVLLAFRNSGKSSIVGLFSAWILLQNANERILVLSADFKLARKMAKNIKRIIEIHPDTSVLIPEKKEKWSTSEFTVKRDLELRDPSVIASGVMGNITGSRADVIICDDVEVPKNCNTIQKREDLRERLRELDFIITPKGLELYIGTPHTKYTIYRV